jgi:hypothetical protein
MSPEKQIVLESEEGISLSNYLSNLKPDYTSPSLSDSYRIYKIDGRNLETIIELGSSTMKIVCCNHLAKKLTREKIVNFTKAELKK